MCIFEHIGLRMNHFKRPAFQGVRPAIAGQLNLAPLADGKSRFEWRFRAEDPSSLNVSLNVSRNVRQASDNSRLTESVPLRVKSQTTHRRG